MSEKDKFSDDLHLVNKAIKIISSSFFETEDERLRISYGRLLKDLIELKVKTLLSDSSPYEAKVSQEDVIRALREVFEVGGEDEGI